MLPCDKGPTEKVEGPESMAPAASQVGKVSSLACVWLCTPNTSRRAKETSDRLSFYPLLLSPYFYFSFVGRLCWSWNEYPGCSVGRTLARRGGGALVLKAGECRAAGNAEVEIGTAALAALTLLFRCCLDGW